MGQPPVSNTVHRRSTASALEGKREVNAEESERLKLLWKKLVGMFHPDLHEHDPEKRKTEG